MKLWFTSDYLQTRINPTAYPSGLEPVWADTEQVHLDRSPVCHRAEDWIPLTSVSLLIKDWWNHRLHSLCCELRSWELMMFKETRPEHGDLIQPLTTLSSLRYNPPSAVFSPSGRAVTFCGVHNNSIPPFGQSSSAQSKYPEQSRSVSLRFTEPIRCQLRLLLICRRNNKGINRNMQLTEINGRMERVEGSHHVVTSWSGPELRHL